MSLAVLFESRSPQFWRDAGGLDRLLYDPPDEDGSEADGLRYLLQVITGEISYATRFQEAIASGALHIADELLRRMPVAARAAAAQQLADALQRRCDACESERGQQLSRIAEIEKRKDLLDDESGLLELARTELQGLSLPTAGDEQVLAHLESCHAKIQDWARYCDSIVYQANERWLKTRRRGFEIIEEVLPGLKQRLLSHAGETTKFDALFVALPALVLAGNIELLTTLASLTRAESEPPDEFVDKLRVLLKLNLAPQQLFKTAPSALGPPPPSDVPLSPYSHQLIRKARLLEDPPYTNEAVFRAAIERLAQAMMPETLVSLYASAAATLRQHGALDQDLAAHALYEEGMRVFERRRYSHAADLLLDAYKLWSMLADTERANSTAQRRTAVALVAANFVLRSGGRLGQPPLQLWQDVPSYLFEQVAQANQNDMVVALWHRLQTRPSRIHFLEFLESAAPLPWRELLLLHLLQPRRLLSDLLDARDRVDILVSGQELHPAFHRLIDEYLSALESAHLHEKFSRRDVTRMAAALERYEADCPGIGGSLERTVRDTLAENVQIYQGMEISRARAPFGVTTTLLTRTLYPDELDGDPCMIIFSVRAHEGGEPGAALVVELALKSAELAPRLFAIDGDPIAEIGALEPGESREVSFQVRIDPKLLTQVSELLLETKPRESSRPLDRCRVVHRIELRPNRPTTRSPFTAGKALAHDDLFVGREREMNILLDNLLGDGSEEIPLIVGIRRIGKTTILRKLASNPDILRRYAPHIFDLQDMAESKSTASFLHDLAVRIRTTAREAKLGELPLTAADFQSDCFSAFERFMDSTAVLSGNRKVLIIFDEFEKLLANLQLWGKRQAASSLPLRAESALVPETLAALRKAMLHAPRVSFVVSGVPRIWHEFQSYDARMFGLMNPLRLHALDESAALKLVNAAKLYKLTEAAQQLLLRISGRQPFLLQVLCEQLFHHMKSSGRDAATTTDVELILAKSILPNEAYWTDYEKLLGDDRDLYRAIALAHRQVGPSRMYVPFELIYKLYTEHGPALSREAVRQRLLQEVKHDERPLIRQRPNHQTYFGLTIGLLIPILARDLR